jgi:hypothetical protein
MKPSRKAKVFGSHGCTTNLHHALIDSVMPHVSGNAWKLLCLIIRQTDGWNRREIGLSYRDLIAGMGVRSRATVAAAIKELEPHNLLVVKAGRSQWEEARYGLNLNAEPVWEPVDFGQPSVAKTVTGSRHKSVTKTGTDAPVTEIAPVPVSVTVSIPEIVTAPVTESVPFNRKETIETIETIHVESNDSTARQVKTIFAYWQKRLNHPNSKLTPERQRKTEARLREGYTVEKIKQGIDGCASSPFNRGENDRGRAFDDLELICRNGSKLENFIALVATKKGNTSNPANTLPQDVWYQGVEVD